MTTDKLKAHRIRMIKNSFLGFVHANTEKLVAQGMDEREAAELALDTAFHTIHETWVEAYGIRRMAEEFYQVADGLVARSMENDK